MANGPLQIVLNSSDFIGDWLRPPGGGHKDFYADNDTEFIAHKNKISTQISTLKSKLEDNEFSEVSYAKVVLKQSAIAKSHRPTAALFNSAIAPVVGAGDLGELIVEIIPESLNTINQKILHAEEVTRYKVTKDGKRKANPSATRSELGAIEEISLYTKADKRKFSITDGLNWILNPQTGGAYIIELFEIPPPRQDWDNFSKEKYRLFKSFYDGLANFGTGISVFGLTDGDKSTAMIGIRLEDSSVPPNIQFRPIQSSSQRRNTVGKITADIKKHKEVISFLDKHPLVKKIILPPIISKSNPTADSTTIGSSCSIPKVTRNKLFPKIGIVDGGVSDVLGGWIEDRWGLVSPADKDENHGTFIAGIAVVGNSLNGMEICKEIDGCKIIDLDILPNENVFANYYREPLQLFRELEAAVKSLKAKTGVRVFNFSLNIDEHVSTNGYSLAAKRLDRIAEENDIIFIISAGNTNPSHIRREWPDNSASALSILASSRNDTIKTPAESARNISVSALNPPNLKGIIPYALSNYSCRGPGNHVGLKPDLGHVGGAGSKVGKLGHGLLSLNASGKIIDGCGTSYAAPNVAKTLACIDHAIEGDVSRESLIAMAVHNATLPAVLQDKNLKDVVKHLVGFGVPMGSEEILEGNENSITLVFANRIRAGKKMSFSFAWPSTLVKNNKCYGHAKLTIVSTPPFNYRFGEEFVRVNLEGYLRQEQKDGKYLGRLNPIYLPNTGDSQLFEKNQIEHAFKWSPIKVFERTFSKGVGPSTNWKLEVEYLMRDGETMPAGGVPFTVLLTISDPEGEQPVFNDMRQSLKALGATIVDIKTAARIVPRV